MIGFKGIIPCLSLLLLLNSIALLGHQNRGEIVNGDVNIALTMARSQLSMHEPIVATFRVKNDTTKGIQLDLGRDRKENFLLTIKTPGGKTITVPQVRKGGFTRNGELAIYAGQTYAQELLLNEWFAFTEIGTYQIKMRLVKPLTSLEGKEIERAKEFVIDFKLTARDEVALTKTCDQLASQIESSNSYEAAAEATRELSFVTDPIAVPYLQRALISRKLVEPIAIEGLERVGNIEAARALSQGLKIEYNDVSLLTRAALQRMESSTADPAIRQEIDRILSQSGASA